MPKFNSVTKVRPTPAPQSPIQTSPVAGGTTYEGAPGFARDTRSELFLLAVTNMVGEGTFYEPGRERDSRYAQLVAQAAVADPTWTAGFLHWLRGQANMRSASLVGAAEAVHAMLAAGITAAPATGARTAVEGSLVLAPAQAEQTSGRRIIDSVLQRADEPGELLAYWTATYGRSIPKPVKRGVADAVARLYTERNLLKYDTASHASRFGDVLELTHAAADPAKPWQGDLFKYAIDRRHGRGESEAPPSLRMIAANRFLRAAAADNPGWLVENPGRLAEAGMTWEDLLSLAGSNVPKAKLWEAIAPSMGYMALLRNLRGFDEAGLSNEAAAAIATKLADPGEVARSRQLPMRFLSAYRAASASLRWSWPLEQALDHALANIPELPGRTLVLVDTSGSMDSVFSKDGTLKRWDAAVVFGLAIGRRSAAADIVSFSTSTKDFPLRKGESLLAGVTRWRDGGYFLNGGTQTELAVRRHFREHDRVVILTDEQATYSGHGDVAAAVPASVPVYTWNLAGYRLGHAAGAANRHTFGGLTDASFGVVQMLERGQDAKWPWLD
jgi:ribosomal protein L18